MSYKALYLKYRPQTFEEVAGQQVIVRTLKNALANDKLAHAYLFAGPRGTGKTTMARLLAKALDCDDGVGHQCNHCSNCEAIADGSHPDVIEIDAASNNGVDQVRELIEKVNYAPIKGRFKVYIIDEVHMMTDAAFNALLKTIEEPPERVIFILCTTEPYKVLPTILSRCQRFDFGKIPEEEMETKLVSVLEKENATFDKKGLRLIMKLADGGMRDALSILDQILAYSGTTLREEDVLAIYGLASDAEKVDLLISMRKGDVSRVVGKSEAYLAGGIDIRRLISELITFLKDLLVFEKTKDPSLMDELSEEDARELSKWISPKDSNQMLLELINAQNDFKNVSDVRSLFELTLLRIASKQETDSEPKPIPEKVAPQPRPIPVFKKETKPTATDIRPEPIVEETKSAIENPKPVLKEEKPLVEEIKPVIQEAKISETNANGVPPSWMFEEDKPLEEGQAFATEPAQQTLFVEENKAVETLKAPETKPSERQKPAEKAKTVEPAKPIDTSGIVRPNIATQGVTFNIEDEQLINIMVLASKKERQELVANWKRLEPLRLDVKFSALANLLFEGKPYALCGEALILSYRFQAKAEKANIVANQEPLQELVAALLGRKVFIYAIYPEVQTRIQKDFFSRQQLSQLPRKDEIQLVLPK